MSKSTRSNPFGGPLEVREGRSAHAAIYLQGTKHNVAVGLKKEDADTLAHRANTWEELLHACQAAMSYFGRSRQWHAPEYDVLRLALGRALKKTGGSAI